VLLLSTIDRGLNLMRVDVFVIDVIKGLIILLAMFIDAQRTRFRAPVVESEEETPPPAPASAGGGAES